MTTPNRVIFTANTQANGTEVYISDGTSAGTLLLRDIYPGTAGSNAYGFTQLGSQVLFSATDGIHGYELWATDGTGPGTKLLRDINPGTLDGFPTSYVAGEFPYAPNFERLGNQLLFVGIDPVHGTELWATDGTSAGTVLLRDINPGTADSAPTRLTLVGNKVLFEAEDGVHGHELWATDGTTAGTVLVRDIYTPAGAWGDPNHFTALGAGGLAIFNAGDDHGRELWITDGTPGGTALLKDINPTAYQSGDPQQAAVLGTTATAVFAATGSAQNTELWFTDGTTAGTVLVKDINPGGSSSPVQLTAFGSKVLFSADDGGGAAIWVTDGTAAGTLRLTADGVQLANIGLPFAFTPFGTKELFWANNAGYSKPWVTDGTPSGTFQLSASASLGNAYGFGVVGTQAYFDADAANYQGAELWTTNGTVAGTRQSADINTISGNSSNPQGFTTVGPNMFFQADDGIHGAELWIEDQFYGARLVRDINNVNYYASSPANITAVTLACFAEGTRIRTARGEVAVERLRAGDLAVTVSGTTRPIRWIGRRTVTPRLLPIPHEVEPVRIAPHAFGPGLPHAPLRVSPDHAIHVDDVLIPARCLLNATTLAREPVERVTWFHVELEGEGGLAVHDVILAEGLPTESYLETGQRGAFANGGVVVDLRPAFDAADAWPEPCARLVMGGPVLDAVRARLAAIAAALPDGFAAAG